MSKIRILGPITLGGEDGSVAKLSGGRERAVLGYLAANSERVVSADELLDALWGDDQPGNPKHALQSAVSRLRRSARMANLDPVATVATGYHVSEGVTVDADRFEEKTGEARALITSSPQLAAETLGEALGLWFGAALADFAYDDWAQPHIARLEEERLTAIGDRIEARLTLGEHRELVAELQRLVVDHPTRERFTAQLMTALYRSGRQEAALAVYGRAKQQLAVELGIEPGPELRQVEQAILEQDPALGPPPGAFLRSGDESGSVENNLPVHLTSFVGRHDDIEALHDLVGEHRLVTLTGPGGTGKTRLAVHLARSILGDYSGGARYVDLSNIATGEQVWPQIAAGTGIREQSSRGLADAVITQLRGSATLLVIDNCEHVLDDAAAAVDRLLRECKQVQLITTSREPLGIDGEVVWPVAPLRIPPAGVSTANRLGEFDSVRLFEERVGALFPGFVIEENTAEAVVAISRAVDGIPLAIELAAARAATMGVDGVAASIDRHLDTLSGGPRTAAERHRSYGAAVRWSYDLVPTEEQRLFRALSVCVGGFDISAAEAIGGLQAVDTNTGLSHLVAASLITSTGPLGTARFGMLEPIRRFALGELETHQEMHSRRRAHAAHYVELSQKLGRGFRSNDQAPVIKTTTTELGNLKAALETTIGASEATGALTVTSALGPYLQIRGRLTEGRHLLGRALEVDGEPDELRATALTDLAHLSFFQCDYHEMLQHGKAALALLDAERDPQATAEALAASGLAKLKLGDQNGSEADLTESARLYSTAGNEWGMGSSLAYLGFALVAAGDIEAAYSTYEESLSHLRDGGESWSAAFALSAQGNLARVAGEDIRSETLLQEALEVSQCIDDSWGEARARLFLARLYLAIDRPEEVRVPLSDAIRAFETMGDREDTALCIETFADFVWLEREAETAAVLYGAVARILERSMSAFSLSTLDQDGADVVVGQLRDELGSDAFEAAIDRGRSTSLRDAVTLALDGRF